MSKNKKWSSAAKFEIALQAIKNKTPLNEICKKYKVSPSQVHAWKKQLLEQGEQLFNKNDKTAKILAEHEETKRVLYETVGQLTVERDFLKKCWTPRDQRQQLVESNYAELSLRRQCELLQVNRSTIYYIPFAHEFSVFRLSLFGDKPRLKTRNRLHYYSLLNVAYHQKSSRLKSRKLMCKGYKSSEVEANSIDFS